MTYGDKETSDSAKIDNLFNNVFTSIAVFHFSPVTEEFVKTQFLRLPNGKATGLDTLSTRLFKTVIHNLATPLTHIFNSSLSTGTVPKDWKSAMVTLIFKDGRRLDDNKYSPVSVQPVTLTVL